MGAGEASMAAFMGEPCQHYHAKVIYQAQNCWYANLADCAQKMDWASEAAGETPAGQRGGAGALRQTRLFFSCDLS